MAEPFDTLMQVQLHDTTLDQLRHRMETLPERAELLEVERRRTALTVAMAEVRAQVDDLTARQRSLEDRIAAAATRRHEIEQRMRSGQAYAPRDLEAMDHEVGQLAARQARFEEEEITLLEEEEPLDVALADHQATLENLGAGASRLEAAITVAEAGIRSSIASEEAQRIACAAGLPADLAERYERLRSHLGGVGAARLVGDRCDGCHLTLSSVELERLRHLPADEYAACAQCDRILVH
jgi:predicted  nucleic acid-binding Zn-ribbon protein